MADLGIQVVQDEDGSWAVRLHIEGEAQELAPLPEMVANHIADCLRIKTALDAGAPPLPELALSRPLETFSDMLEDLRVESMESVMDALAQAAAEGEEGLDGEAEGDQGGLAGDGEAHVSGADGSGGAAATDGGSVAGGGAPQRPPHPALGAPEAMQGQQEQQQQLVQGGRQDAASDQTDVPLAELAGESAAGAGDAQPSGAADAAKQQQQQGRATRQSAPSTAPSMEQPPAGNKAAAAAPGKQRQQPVRKQGQQEQNDAELARKLQQELNASARYASRQRRSAAPAEGTLQIPGERNWFNMGTGQRQNQGKQSEGPASAAAAGAAPMSPGLSRQGSLRTRGRSQGKQAAEGAEEAEEREREEEEEEEQEEEDGERVEFKGVAARRRGEEQRWLATISATLNREECPSEEGRKHHSLPVCECGSQAEAAVARDLALLWREGRLGYLPGDLTWQPEEYNMDVQGYHSRLDVGPALPKCRTLSDLRALLAKLCEAGTLAELAGSLTRNPLSLIVHDPPVEPCTQATQTAVRQRYQGVHVNGDGKTPWRASITLRRKSGLAPAVFGTFGTAAQAAAAADMAVVWREARQKEKGKGNVEGQKYNFPLQGYREEALVWSKLLAADNETDLRILLRKLRDCGMLHAIAQRLQQLAEQQGQETQQQQQQPGQQGQQQAGAQGASPASPAAPGPATGAGAQNGGKKRGRGSAGTGGSGGASSGPGKRSKKAATPAAAVAAAAEMQADAAAEADAPDPLPVIMALSEAASTPEAQAAGLTLPLCGAYAIALQAKSAKTQTFEISLLQLWLGGQKWGAIKGMMVTAVGPAVVARLEQEG